MSTRQPERTLSEYYERLDRNEIPIVRGIELSRDDLARRSVIHAIMCQFEVSKEAVGVSYLIDFDEYFAPELKELREFERAGLLELHDEWISVTAKGRMLICSICMVFDQLRYTSFPSTPSPERNAHGPRHPRNAARLRPDTRDRAP